MVGHLVGAKRFEDAYQRGLKSLKWGFFIIIKIVFCFWLFCIPLLDTITEDQNIITSSFSYSRFF